MKNRLTYFPKVAPEGYSGGTSEKIPVETPEGILGRTPEGNFRRNCRVFSGESPREIFEGPREESLEDSHSGNCLRNL